jgi:hypothetical protein
LIICILFTNINTSVHHTYLQWSYMLAFALVHSHSHQHVHICTGTPAFTHTLASTCSHPPARSHLTRTCTLHARACTPHPTSPSPWDTVAPTPPTTVLARSTSGITPSKIKGEKKRTDARSEARREHSNDINTLASFALRSETQVRRHMLLSFSNSPATQWFDDVACIGENSPMGRRWRRPQPRFPKPYE